MWFDIFGLVISLAIILLSCELFTNGIEWLGKKLKLGDGVVGSIFSAVGTCLPETIVPIIAILFSDKTSSSVDIGIGAIMGAPFMLATLAFFLSGLSVIVFGSRRKTGMDLLVNTKILARDIGFFIVVYCIGLAAALFKSEIVKFAVAVFLIGYYIYYIILTVKGDRASRGDVEELYLGKLFDKKPSMALIVLQIAIALAGIVFGAELFIENIRLISELLAIPTLVLSLIITPVATELPEKFNSIIWISKKKDTLALGNITGAMVFQSCIPISIGIISTSWELDIKVLMSALMALLSALVTFVWIKVKGRLSALPLLCGGIFYIIFILFLVSRGFQ